MAEDLEMWPYHLSFSLPWLGDHHALQLHSEFCCEPPRSSHGLCRTYSAFWSPCLCLSCICLLVMHTLICVILSLPPGVMGWLRLLLVSLPGLFYLPFWSSPLLLHVASDLLSWSLFGSHLSCLSSVLSCLGRSPFCTLWWLYRDGLPGRHCFFLFCIYDIIICKSDADTTFMVSQCLKHDSL